MRSQGRAVDQIDYRPLSPSECLSTASSFSPSSSPIRTPTTRYSQRPFPMSGWREVGSSAGHTYGTAPAPIPDNLAYYDENLEQFWVSPEVAYEKTDTFLCQPPVTGNLEMTRNSYNNRQTLCLPAYMSNPYLSRPIFNQPEGVPVSASGSNFLRWMPSTDPIPEQTLTSSQDLHQEPLTPPSPCAELYTSDIMKTRFTTTPHRSFSLNASFDTELSARRDPLVANCNGNLPSRSVYQNSSPSRHQQQPSGKITRRQLLKQGLMLENIPPIIKQVQFRCSEPGCKGRFKRQEHLKRHMKSHSKDRPYVCWVPGCHRAFSRSDNLNAHYSKTHSKRGGRNRYVSTLDETSSDYDPNFRGQLTPDGRPIYGSKLWDVR